MSDPLALHIASLVKNGQIIGLGSGRTTERVLQTLGERIKKEGLRFMALATSHRTTLIAAENGIEVLSPVSDVELDWAFDGADQVEPSLRVIKGNGAAMLPEKIIAHRARHFYVIVTPEKLVTELGGNQPIPLEIFSNALPVVKRGLRELGATKIELRPATGKYGPIVSENGNLIIDAWFSHIPQGFERELKCIVGVAENGLFEKQVEKVFVAEGDTIRTIERP